MSMVEKGAASHDCDSTVVMECAEQPELSRQDAVSSTPGYRRTYDEEFRNPCLKPLPNSPSLSTRQRRERCAIRIG